MRDIFDELITERSAGKVQSCNCGHCAVCRENGPSLISGETNIIPSIAPTEQELEIVGAVDDRKRIYSSTHKVPFRWVCRIIATYRNPSKPWETVQTLGTGVLVGPGHVLTCGHNIYNRVNFSEGAKKTWASSFEIVPGMRDDSYRPFGTYTTSVATIHSGWSPSLNPRFDLGMIKLNTKVGYKKFNKIGKERLGYWGSSKYGHRTRIISFDRSTQKGKKINLAGFPFDKGVDQMWWDADQIVNMFPAAGKELFYYKTDTCAGHSGSPIWLTNTSTDSRFLIGIHTGPCIPVSGSADCQAESGLSCAGSGVPKRSSNRGIFLDKGVINLVRSWIRNL